MTTEQQVLAAAIESIEKYGIGGTTIRKIAEIAGVNSAAISYYYRSKDALIKRAMQETLKNAFTLQDFADSESFAPKERLMHIFSVLMECAVRYPGLTRVHFHEVFTEGSYTAPSVKQINAFLRDLELDLMERGLQMEKQELRRKLTMVISSLLVYPGIMPDMLHEFSGLSLSDPNEREQYIRLVIDSLF